MSVVSRTVDGERVVLSDRRKPPTVRPAVRPATLIRNRRWLLISRELGLTTREVAHLVNQPDSTVRHGIAAALAEEQRLHDGDDLTTDPDPEICPTTGLTRVDVIHLLTTHAIDSPLLRHPIVRKVLAPLVALLRAEMPDDPLFVAFAA